STQSCFFFTSVSQCGQNARSVPPQGAFKRRATVRHCTGYTCAPQGRLSRCFVCQIGCVKMMVPGRTSYRREWLSLRLWRRLLLGLAAAFIGAPLALGGPGAAVPVFHLLAGGWVLVTFIFHCALAGRFRPAASGPPTSPRAWRGFRILELMTCNIV